MKTLFAILALIGSTSSAQEVLTREHGNLLVSVPLKNTLYREDYQSRIDRMIDFFEQKVYSKVPPDLVERMKTEPMKIEVAEMKDNGAFFRTREEKSGRLLIQISPLFFSHDSLFRLLAHEWFHALQFVIHPDEPAWLREGLAQVFEHIVLGDTNGPALIDALTRSSTRLEADFSKYNLEAYGHTFLYFYHLYQKCGGSDVFWKLARSAPDRFGRDTVNLALSENPAAGCSNFINSAIEAEISRFHNRKIYQVPPAEAKRYWLIEKLEISAQLNAVSALEPESFDRLPAFQPLLVDSKYRSKVMKLIRPGVQVFVLPRTMPYQVKKGLPDVLIYEDLILIIKTE